MEKHTLDNAAAQTTILSIINKDPNTAGHRKCIPLRGVEDFSALAEETMERKKSVWDATGPQVAPRIQKGTLTNHPGQDMCCYRPAKSNPRPSTDNHICTNSPHPRLAHTMAACGLGPGGTSCSASVASGSGCRQCTQLLLLPPPHSI